MQKAHLSAFSLKDDADADENVLKSELPHNRRWKSIVAGRFSRIWSADDEGPLFPREEGK